MVRDRDEITLILDEDVWNALLRAFQTPRSRAPGDDLLRYRSRLLGGGFIAEISRALAEADISILSISTYHRCVLVHESRFEAAVAPSRTHP